MHIRGLVEARTIDQDKEATEGPNAHFDEVLWKNPL